MYYTNMETKTDLNLLTNVNYIFCILFLYNCNYCNYHINIWIYITYIQLRTIFDKIDCIIPDILHIIVNIVVNT